MIGLPGRVKRPAGLLINWEIEQMFKNAALLFLFLSINAVASEFCGYDNYIFDANDFAVEWTEYNPNGMGRDWLNGKRFDNPENVLGRPTVDTTGDDWYFPEDDMTAVNPTYPAFRSYELLYLGEQGYVTVKFNHPVRDDDNNPYGIDLIVFGNSMQVIGAGQGWTNGDPALTSVGPEGHIEPAVVSVSQDNVTWYSFTSDPNFMEFDSNFIKFSSDPNDSDYDPNDGPFCDSFAPTLGRVYDHDPVFADPNLITDPNSRIDQWWAEPTNPTFPVNPNLWFNSFDGSTVAEICQVYDNSAGGTGYDIGRLDLPADPETGKKWFIYVRVDDKVGGGEADLDAFADVTCCGDYRHPYPTGDITQDCIVNLEDFVLTASFWLDDFVDPQSPASVADLLADNSVNLSDLYVLADNWLECTWDCK